MLTSIACSLAVEPFKQDALSGFIEAITILCLLVSESQPLHVCVASLPASKSDLPPHSEHRSFFAISIDLPSRKGITVLNNPVFPLVFRPRPPRFATEPQTTGPPPDVTCYRLPRRNCPMFHRRRYTKIQGVTDRGSVSLPKSPPPAPAPAALHRTIAL